jgi:hypothetical protein
MVSIRCQIRIRVDLFLKSSDASISRLFTKFKLIGVIIGDRLVTCGSYRKSDSEERDIQTKREREDAPAKRIAGSFIDTPDRSLLGGLKAPTAARTACAKSTPCRVTSRQPI